MKNFLIVVKDSREKNTSLADKMTAEIEHRGGKAKICIEPPRGSDEAISVPPETDCILTVGGDGSLIRAARRTLGSGVPLLGVNQGHLGYLCDLDEETVFDAIESLISGKYETEERMMLEGYVEPDGKCVCHALNDIVISSENPAQVIALTVYVNGTALYRANGDGIIFSTPTGSTAYNLSASGPIVDPLMELILMTPINPHTLNSRSIILSDTDEISVEIEKRRNHTKESALCCFDGNGGRVILPGERVTIKKAKEKTRMIRLSKMNFLERISRKLRSEAEL